jgi:hypothetical protein
LRQARGEAQGRDEQTACEAVSIDFVVVSHRLGTHDVR